jgi:hypothetical protein
MVLVKTNKESILLMINCLMLHNLEMIFCWSFDLGYLKFQV